MKKLVLVVRGSDIRIFLKENNHLPELQFFLSFLEVEPEILLVTAHYLCPRLGLKRNRLSK